MSNSVNYNVSVPDGWHRIEDQCEPRNGSKVWRSDTTDANVNLVNLHGSGSYVVNGEDKNGEWFDERCYDYFEAAKIAENFMSHHE